MAKSKNHLDYLKFTPRVTIFRLILVLIYALIFGRWYNRQVDEIVRQGNEWENTAPLVAVGTFFTIIALIPLYGWRVFLITLGLFISSGSQMILGSAKRTNETVILKDSWRKEFDGTLDQLIDLWSK